MQARNDGSTALHAAVCEGNEEMVRFLLKQGADVDRPDIHGWTPRDLADHQGHEEIKELFLNLPDTKTSPFLPVPNVKRMDSKLAKFKSDPAMPLYSQDGSVGKSTRRRACNFSNSLFGMMSAANIGELLFSLFVLVVPNSHINFETYDITRQ